MLGTSTTTVGVTGATGPAMGAAGMVTGTTGATGPATGGQPAAELQGQATNSAPGNRINAMMLYYAVSVYAYRAAYLETIKNIQESADGHGLFKLLPANLLGETVPIEISPEELKKSKSMSMSPAAQENEQQAMDLANDEEALKASGMSKEQFLASLDIEPLGASAP